MFHKTTFKTDDEMNDFFHQHPNIYIIKYVIAGNGLQHVIWTVDRRMKGKNHLQRVQNVDQPSLGFV